MSGGQLVPAPLTTADVAALLVCDDATLAAWWCELNEWGWPKDLPDPEQPRFGAGLPHDRRWAAMNWILDRIGLRACLRHHNRWMTDDEFATFYDRRGPLPARPRPGGQETPPREERS